MSAISFEICTCDCHDPNMEVYHCMPCCSICQHCGQNIRRGWEDEHEERCAKEREELGLALNLYVFGGPATLDELVKPTKTIYEQIQEEIDQEVLAEMQKDFERARLENSPAVKFLRECQERERKLGK